MKKILSAILCLAMLLGLAACNLIVPGTTGTTGTTTTDGGTVTPSGTTKKSTTSTTGKVDDDPNLDVFDKDELEIFGELFDHENHISLELDISDVELKKLQADYEKYKSMGSKSPIYRMADLYVTITKPDGSELKYTIEQVGVRMKGNTSRNDFYSDENGMYSLVHFKVDFGQTFDDAEYYGDDALVWTDTDARKARKDRTFATLEKIDMKWNRNDDTTYIRESYAYDFYRELGVLAPHTNLASVNIGADHAGVWTFYEPVDKIFLQKNLPESALGGDLYKLGWTNTGATFTSFEQYGVEDEDSCSFYVYDLKTNKKKSDHSSLKTLITTINSDRCTSEDFASVVDVDNFLTYCAASYIIGNPDDLRNNYNNTYIYFRADTGKVLFIPYDMDRGFGVNGWNPYGDGMTTDSPFMERNVCGEQKNPIFSKTIHNGGFFTSEYVEELKRISTNEMLDKDCFATAFNTAKNLYADETRPSKSYNNCGGYAFTFDNERSCNASDSANMSFADYIAAKTATMNSYIKNTPIIDPVEPGEYPDKTDDRFELYIRGDFTGWGVDSGYRLSHTSDGVFSIEITRDSRFEFKIYDNDDEEWYGGDRIVDGCEVSYEVEGSHANIVLPAGSYTIYFYCEAREINIVSK